MKEVDYQNERVDAINETTAMAHETTLLNPRFYTTNFKEMDELNVESVRKDWDELISEMKSDPNRTHFKKTEDWDKIDFKSLNPELRKEFIDFLVSSLNFSIPIKLPPGWLFELKRVPRIYESIISSLFEFNMSSSV